MWICSLTIENFKSFCGEPVTFNFYPGVNYFVGDNNVGKTTAFRALESLVGGFPKDDSHVPRAAITGPTEITATVADVTEETLKTLFLSKLLPYIHPFEHGDAQVSGFKVRRSMRETESQQNKKVVKLDQKKIQFYHPENEQWENPVGIDKTVSQLLKIFPIWANMDPSDVGNFSTTKTMGRLLNEIFGDVETTPEWGRLLEAHESVFSDPASSINQKKAELEKELQSSLSHGFDSVTEVKIDFNLPNSQAHLKNGEIQVDDGIMGEISEKGDGLQRTIATALLRMFSTRSHVDGTLSALLMDEPETWLHPRAQISLSRNLEAIGAKNGQVFVSTHSPYIFRNFRPEMDGIHILTVDNGVRNVKTINELGVSQTGRPSLAEISYKAFGDATPEYHNELFGKAHLLAQEKKLCKEKPSSFDTYLKDTYPDIEHKRRIWRKINKETNASSETPLNESLPVCIRNLIDHPENDANEPWEYAELERSIAILEESLSDLRCPSTPKKDPK